MFQFTGFPSLTLFDSCKDDRSLSCRVSPFRYPWINTYLQLPKAFRSLSRLSSALSAKASTLRSSLYDLWSLTIALVILFLCVHKVFLGFLGCLESSFQNFSYLVELPLSSWTRLSSRSFTRTILASFPSATSKLVHPSPSSSALLGCFEYLRFKMTFFHRKSYCMRFSRYI